MKKFFMMFSLLVAMMVVGMANTVSAAAPHVLFVAGHPDMQKSVAASIIADEVEKNVENVEVLRLGNEYPTYTIDVEKERERVLRADVIVFHYPIWWYSGPAIFKNWQEQVFTFGFAHDAKGGMLNGRTMILSMTSGAPASDYQLGGRMNYPMDVFQLPIYQMGELCGLDFGGMVYTGGFNLGLRDKMRAQQTDMAKAHAAQLIEKIKAAQAKIGDK